MNEATTETALRWDQTRSAEPSTDIIKITCKHGPSHENSAFKDEEIIIKLIGIDVQRHFRRTEILIKFHISQKVIWM
jgi:hypothetical protein